MSATKQINYIDVIKDIEEFYEANSITVYPVITSTTLKYKPLSVEQLKEFIELQISAAKDEFGVHTGLEAVTMLNNLIVNNNVDHTDSLLSTLSVLDRDAIVLQLRANIKDVVEVTGDDDETQSIKLTDIISRIKKAKVPKALKSRSTALKYTAGEFNVSLKLPSLQVDQDINNKFKKTVIPKLNKGTKHVEKNVEKILSQVYFLEIYKYIDTVTINKKDHSSVIDFRDLDVFDQSFSLLGKLPTQVIAAISEYMTDVRKFRDDIFYYEDDTGKQVPLDIDIGLFAGI